MDVETTRMSSKGQIVIPQDIREEMNAREGTLFVVIGGKDTIILKKIEVPSKQSLIRELEGIAREGRGRLEKRGIREKDIYNIVQKVRRR